MASEIETERKITAHEFEPVGNPDGGLALQEVKPGKARGGPCAVAALRRLVEQSGDGWLLRHGRTVAGSSSNRKGKFVQKRVVNAAFTRAR